MIIIQDKQEKQPWDFSFYERCSEIRKESLLTGDYTMLGYEDVLRIERKATTGEISLNLGKLSKQFEAEMTRIQSFEHAYLLCEFSIENVLEFPLNSNVPKYLWKTLRMNGKFMLNRLYELSEKYNFSLEFCGDKDSAYRRCIEIFENVEDKI